MSSCRKVQTKAGVFSVDADDVRHSRALRNGVFCVVNPRGLDAFVPRKVGSSAVGDITYELAQRGFSPRDTAEGGDVEVGLLQLFLHRTLQALLQLLGVGRPVKGLASFSLED